VIHFTGHGQISSAHLTTRGVSGVIEWREIQGLSSLILPIIGNRHTVLPLRAAAAGSAGNWERARPCCTFTGYLVSHILG
jgi:hypothetical protein